MPDIALGSLSRSEKFRLVTGSVMPRPIALVTTLNDDGSCNAAPFSAFNYMSDDPPILAIGIDRYAEESPTRQGEMKDTLRNVVARPEFVVNMVDMPLIHQVVGCATDFPAGMSEPAANGLELAASVLVTVPRVAQTPIAWECRRHSIIEIGPARSILLGEILSIHFRPGLLDEAALRVNIEQFLPVGRLGGPNYATTVDRFTAKIAPFQSGS